MSIKNIIQQENDLQEMSQQSLANYLNNPTGQYNPYLVAGELQRKEAFAQRQMTEAPQGTVVDELVAKTMPMGGMPMGAPMGGMPMPRPEEVMVSDTITETGIANLPAPNIGQNYADGGIVGYEEGGEVGFFEKRLNALEEGMDERTKRNQKNIGIYQETGSFPEMTEQDLDDAIAFGGLGAIGKVGGKTRPYIKDAAKKGLDYIKNKIKPTPTKPLTKKKRAQKIKDDKVKAKTDKAAQKKKDALKGTPGGVDRAIISGGKAVLGGVGRGLGALGRGMKANPLATGIAGTVGAGFGLDALLNEGVLYGETPEEKAQREAKEIYDSPAEVEKRARAARYEAGIRAQQARADEQEAALKKRREKEMYLALALGGAKTMAGQSQFALTNIGEGLGAGVGALAAYDQNEMERVAASQAATAKAQQDMELALMDLDMEYRGEYVKLIETKEYLDFVKQVGQELEDGEIAPPKDGSMTGKQVAQAKINDFVQNRIGLEPRKSREARINNQLFQAME